MKNLSLFLVAAALLMVSSSSFALVRVVTTCQTSDNLYRVSILDNEGIGPVRTANYGAVVYNANNQVVANYAVKSNLGEIKSASFGQTMYTDVQTNGALFVLAFGSTNYRHITLKARLNNGTQVNELDPKCLSFGVINK